MSIMHYYEVAPNQIARAGSDTFTYHSREDLSIGQIVSVPLGKKSVIGVVFRRAEKPNFDTRPIDKVLIPTPLPASLIRLADWLSEYYVTPLATVLQTILPKGMQKKRRTQKLQRNPVSRERTNIVLNNKQRQAVTTVTASQSSTILLHGITGSGKTAVYIESAKTVLARGKSVILLVPEIALTSQLVDEFSHHFTDIILTHSRQTEAQRHVTWQQALESSKPRVAIGPRSALFLPLKDVGLIVVDEAHEPSFKQEQSPRYSAIRAATMLGRFHSAPVVLGSATPSITDYYLSKSTNGKILALDTSARKDTVKPTVILIDMTKRSNFKKHRFLSDSLLQEMSITLESGKQCLIFHNRRGSASTTLCENCGWIAGCPRCFVPLTLHTDTHQMMCHICGLHGSIPSSCPECHEADIIHKGIGTKVIESELRKIFSDKTIVRFDADTARHDSVEARYSELYKGSIDIAIGTQVLAKGLDLPELRTVGVVQADAGLSLPDYGSSERTFQLLAQVLGRVGRSKHPTTVVAQSYQPSHPSVTFGMNQDYGGFYQYALAERKHSNFPPFSYLLKLTNVYKTESTAINNARKLASTLRSTNIPDIQILGPAPAFYERQHDTYRWQLIIKSPKRQQLIKVLEHLPAAHWQFELDPTSLL